MHKNHESLTNKYSISPGSSSRPLLPIPDLKFTFENQKNVQIVQPQEVYYENSSNGYLSMNLSKKFNNEAKEVEINVYDEVLE